MGLNANPDLNPHQVVIMGGVEPVDPSGPDDVTLLTPDTANNNTFDPVASAFFYRRCQERPNPNSNPNPKP